MGEQGAKRHNDSWKGIGVTIVILAIATGIGAMFRYLRFTEANILIVYVLGVMITGRDHGKQNVECAFLPLQCSAF